MEKKLFINCSTEPKEVEQLRKLCLRYEGDNVILGVQVNHEDSSVILRIDVMYNTQYQILQLQLTNAGYKNVEI